MAIAALLTYKLFFQGGCIALLFFWETVAPAYVRDARGRFMHIGKNGALAVINTLLLSVLYITAVGFVADITTRYELGVFRMTNMSPVFVWGVGFLAFDCALYWWHRINHRLPILWRFHSVHHLDTALDVSSAVRFHTGEIALSIVHRMLFVLLFGVDLTHMAVFEFFVVVCAAFNHANIRLPVRVERFLTYCIVTPRMHRIHHSPDRALHDSNYCTMLSVWDLIFCSFSMWRVEEPRRSFGLFGKDGCCRDKGLLHLLRHPFLKKPLP